MKDRTFVTIEYVPSMRAVCSFDNFPGLSAGVKCPVSETGSIVHPNGMVICDVNSVFQRRYFKEVM